MTILQWQWVMTDNVEKYIGGCTLGFSPKISFKFDRTNLNFFHFPLQTSINQKVPASRALPSESKPMVNLTRHCPMLPDVFDNNSCIFDGFVTYEKYLQLNHL